MNFNPVIAIGDFDGNGKVDQAVLIQRDKGKVIAICLLSDSGTKLVVIDNPYCRDYINTSPANLNVYNYDTDKTETLKRDSVSTYCFEQAGAVYVYENGAFRKIINSD